MQFEGQVLVKMMAVGSRAAAGSGPLGLSAPGMNASSPQTAAASNSAFIATSATGNAPAGLIATVLRSAQPAPAAATTPGAPMAGANAASPGVPTDLAAGTRLVVRIAQVVPPSAGGETTPVAVPESGASTAPPSSPSPQGSAGPAQSVAPPPSTGSGPPPLATLAATVTDHGPGGQAIVKTPAGLLTLPAADELPVGAQATLEVVEPPLPPLSPPSTNAPPPPGLGKDGWPAMQEALQTLAESGDASALDQVLRQIPQVGPRMAATLSLMATAVVANEGGGLVGEGGTKALDKSGKSGLAARIKADLAGASQAAARPLGDGEWRGMTLPMWSGQRIEPIELYLRRHQTEEVDADEKKGRGGDEHRFVFDLSLSRLGRMQFDGLVKRDVKRFDLIIRTEKPFPERMRQDIAMLFTLTGDAVGTKGSVMFRSNGRFIDFPPPVAGTARIMV